MARRDTQPATSVLFERSPSAELPEPRRSAFGYDAVAGPTSMPNRNENTSFYEAASLGLRALDARATRSRRFGPDADATWRAFRGELTDGDRLDLLLRDAA